MPPPANVRYATNAPFPALVTGTNPITVNKVNGIWSIGFTAGQVGPAPSFASRNAAALSKIDVNATYIQTAGFYNAGDGGGALYFRTTGTTPGGFQSADGAWWQLEKNKEFSILQFGAVPDFNLTDNHTAFQNAVDYIGTYNGFGAGGIYVPGGAYMIGSTIVINSNTFIHMHGDTFTTSTIVVKPGLDATAIQADSSYFTMDRMVVWGAKAFRDTGAFGSSTPALLINGGSPRFRNCQFLGGNPTLHCVGAEPSLVDCVATLSYGDIIQFEEGGWLNRCSFDVNLPAGSGVYPATINPWIALHHYNVGDFASLSGYIIQCTVAGTTGASPPALANYAVDMVDASATWQVFAPVNAIGLHMVGICQETHFHQLDNAFPIQIDTTPLSGGSFNFFITDSAVEGVVANTGVGLYVSHCELAGAYSQGATPRAIAVASTWGGDVSIIDNEMLNVGQYGVRVLGGTNTRITNNTINNASVAAVRIGATVTDVIVSENGMFGNAIAVDILPGANYYIVTNNLVHGSTVGINEPTPGANRTVTGNL